MRSGISSHRAMAESVQARASVVSHPLAEITEPANPLVREPKRAVMVVSASAAEGPLVVAGVDSVAEASAVVEDCA